MIYWPRASHFCAFLVIVGLALCLPTTGSAQSGATLTPDRQTFLVNKDLGAERWTISAGLATDDVESVISATGNVFRSDGGPPSFVLCQVRDDSTGSLSDPESVFRLTCRGTDACQTNARECARDQWRPIADAVEIPAAFFLPAGGLGDIARTGSVAQKGVVSSWLDRAVSWGREALGLPVEGVAQGIDRGATLSLDRLNHLVNKDVGGQRWSIGLNFVPVETESGGTTNELLSVTGNVFFPDGSPPSFVYCTEREDSTGALEDAASEFRFRCSGASACGTTAAECAAAAWTPIADDVRLGASFFLPPGGLPPSAQSDPEIFVIGKTSDPPSIVTKEFTIPEGDGLARVAGGATCPVGATCLADRVGSCTQVSGGAVDVEGFGCGCEIPDVPPGCITCGGGATGSCGASGGYPVGNMGRTARGVCLPFSAQSQECVVYAVASGGSEDRAVNSCGGPLGASCSGDRCCADDPRDGCRTADGSEACSGICVAAGGCDPATEQCGACFAEEPPAESCGNGVRESGEECDQEDLNGESCESQGFDDGALGCNSRCEFDTSECLETTTCGNGLRDPNEECDGADLGQSSCSSLGLGTGTLECDEACNFDTSSCVEDECSQGQCADWSVTISCTCDAQGACVASLDDVSCAGTCVNAQARLFLTCSTGENAEQTRQDFNPLLPGTSGQAASLNCEVDEIVGIIGSSNLQFEVATPDGETLGLGDCRASCDPGGRASETCSGLPDTLF